MRISVLVAVTALSLAWIAPASAQMCGAPQAAGSTTSATAGGMCGTPARPVAEAPMSMPNAPAQSQAAGGCSCCRQMAMMQSQPHAMPEAPRPQ
jgi:hypothetical protein